MTREQARFLLAAWQPERASEDLPAMEEALAQTCGDPEMGQWFAEERLFDEMVASKLAAAQPPAKLRGLLLAGLSVCPRIPWWRRYARAIGRLGSCPDW